VRGERDAREQEDRQLGNAHEDSSARV
jgi:hypothetical protein